MIKIRDKFNVKEVIRAGNVEYDILISKGLLKLHIGDAYVAAHEKNAKKYFASEMSGELYGLYFDYSSLRKISERIKEIKYLPGRHYGVESLKGEVLRIDYKDGAFVLDCGFIINFKTDKKESLVDIKEGSYILLTKPLVRVNNLKKESEKKPVYIFKIGENPQPDGKILKYKYWEVF